MCRSKKTAIVFALMFVLLCTACGTSESTATSGAVAKENYLNVNALDRQGGQLEAGQYQVYTLEKGIFVEEALGQTLERAYINATIACVELPCEQARFASYAASYFVYVEKGDLLATFYADVDTVALEQAELELQRLEERFAQAELDHVERAEELVEKMATEYDSYEDKVLEVQRIQEELDWANTKRTYENNIKDIKETIKELEETGNVIEVYAPAEGLAVPTKGYAPGAEVKDGDYLCHIIPVDEYYVSTDKRTDLYNFGMEMTFKTRAGATTGTVISADSKVLYGNLDKHDVVFSIATSDTISQDDLNASRSLAFEGNAKVVENVILIPKAAVTVEEDEYFVTVLQEDGSLLKTEFIAGGSNTEYYWVFDGLSEGMNIIMK